MEKLIVKGGNPLYGKVGITGAKNAAVAIVPATVMASEGICQLDNIPDIEDIQCLEKMLTSLGCRISKDGNNSFIIDSREIETTVANTPEVRRMRASYYLAGALLGRFKKAKVDLPGGCDLGERPIDQHIKGFEALGAEVTVENGVISVEAKELKGANIYFDVVSVGATINVMLAASLAEGTTLLENAAKEPHVVDVANFLNTMGAKVKGAGTDVIKIQGVKSLKGCDYTVVPDQIEAGTFMIAAAACGGEVVVDNVIPKHLESITAKLLEMGVTVIEGDDSVTVSSNGNLKGVNIKTLPYPGFPTDIQQPMTVLLSISNGKSTVNESIWGNRFKYIDELNKMGSHIKVEGTLAIIEGVDKLKGAKVIATDLRAGAAMVVAGLVANGITEITNIEHIDRGYPHIEDKFRSLGGEIMRVKE